MLQSHNRIMTQRRFNRVSEDPINGSKAMTVRRQLRDLDIYKQNLSSAKALFNAAEINLMSLAHDDYIKIEEKLVAAANGTWEDMDLNIYAKELEEIAEHMVTTLNHDFSERQLFGGSSNGATPFQIQRVKIEDADGNVVFPPDYNKYYNADGTLKEGVKASDVPRVVTYNGVPLDFDVTSDLILPDGTLTSVEAGTYKVSALDEETGKWEDETIEFDTTKAIEEGDNSLIYPGSKPIYVDIGLGIKYNENYEVDPQTALDVSMNGAAITGNGIDVSGVETVCNKELSGTPRADHLSEMRNGYPENQGLNINITINGVDMEATIWGRYLPTKTDGTQYSNAEISQAALKAISDTYTQKTGETLPSDINITLGDDGNFTASAYESEISFGINVLGLPQNKAPEEVPGKNKVKLDKDGVPDLSNRYSKNLMQLVLDAVSALRNSDQSRTNAIIDRAKEANNHILTEITTLGTKQNSIEFYESKNEDYKFNLLDRQNVVEGTDMENEITRYEAIKAAYDATLKMGSQILPHSIFDFI